MQIRATALACAIIACALPVAAPAEHWKTVCNIDIPATMVDTVDSGVAFPGERFRFRTTETVRFGTTLIPENTTGYGFVRAVTAASNRNRNGSLVLELRALYMGSREINVIGDPREGSVWAHASSGLVDRASGYLPIPGIIRTAVNEVRDGKNVSIGPGFKFNVVPFTSPRDGTPCRKVVYS